MLLFVALMLATIICALRYIISMHIRTGLSPYTVAVVGMEVTSYTVIEDEIEVVEVCALVHSPNDTSSNCPIQFPFNVTGLSTINGTAGNNIHRSHKKTMIGLSCL